MKTITFYCNWGVSKKNGKHYLASVHSRYLLEAAKRFERVSLISKEVEYNEQHDQCIDNIAKCYLLPKFSSYISAVKHIKSITNTLKKCIYSGEVFYIRSPEPFSWYLHLINKNNNRAKLVYHFASNPLEAIENKINDSWVVKKVKKTLYYPEFLMNCYAANRNITTCNGKGLKKNLEKFFHKKVSILNESTLNYEDYFQRENTCAERRIKLLYVGYIRAAKGLDYLIEALSDIEKKDPEKYSLTIIGDGDYTPQLREHIKKHDLKTPVCFKGHMAFGKQLLDNYRNHDIFILPSLSEGSPRVVVEAMANSIPVIATKCWQYKNVLANGRGICVTPKSSQEIVNAIHEITENEKIRKKMISLSFEYAKELSLQSYFDNFQRVINES